MNQNLNYIDDVYKVEVMVAEWVKEPAVWCNPWPGHVLGLWVRIPLWSAYPCRAINCCRCNQLYSCQSNKKHTFLLTPWSEIEVTDEDRYRR